MMLCRKDFIAAVAKATGRKPSTIAQCLYSHAFQPHERRAEKHLNRPFYGQSQVKAAANLVLRIKEAADEA